MSSIQREIGSWIWRLLPANPILLRVIFAGGRRMRHQWIRFNYLVILFVIMLVALLSSVSGTSGGLDDLARNSTWVFTMVSLVQLGLISLVAPIFTAAAITQEKDSRTYNILLSTPLTNAQIVLGSLCSRLFFVFMLLLAALPIFCVTMVYGGVTLRQILISTGIAACTAAITGSLAIAVSVIKVGTRRTTFFFYLVIAGYLLVIGALARLEVLPAPAPVNQPQAPTTSWLAAFHPFLSMFVVLNIHRAPDMSQLGAYEWPGNYWLAFPHYSYMVMTLIASVTLTCISMLFVRSENREGEVDWWTRIRKIMRLQPDPPVRRKPHWVWQNPVAWRESATRIALAQQHLVRYTLIIGGGALAGILMIGFQLKWWPMTWNSLHIWLNALIMAEFAIILLITTNSAASAITREREADTMDLLLATPLSSRYIIWGKLRGLVSFVAPLIAVPVGTVFIFALVDLKAARGTPWIPLESSIYLCGLMIIYTALAAVLGIYMSLICRTTLKAISFSVSALVLGCGLMFVFGFALAQQSVAFGSFITAFTPFTAILLVATPAVALDDPKIVNQMPLVRTAFLFGTVAALAVYSLVVWGMYRNMAHNFDMILRKQSR